MAHRSKEMRDLVGDVLDDAGIEGYVFGLCKANHQTVKFRQDGKDRCFKFPKTPGDRMSLALTKTRLRRFLRGETRLRR